MAEGNTPASPVIDSKEEQEQQHQPQFVFKGLGLGLKKNQGEPNLSGTNQHGDNKPLSTIPESKKGKEQAPRQPKPGKKQKGEISPTSTQNEPTETKGLTSLKKIMNQPDFE